MTGALLFVLAATLALPTPGKLDGNRLLALAARLNRPPATYAVPQHFEVRMRRPIGFRFHADAIAYFQAPDRQALVITSMPRVLRRMFVSSYGNLDTVAQNWPAHYRVFSAARRMAGGVPVFHLDAVPAAAGGTLTHVTFDLAVRGLVPLGVEWFFNDGSSIRLAVVNERVGGYALPRIEDITVSMPRLSLEAVGTAGAYSLDPVIPDGVFPAR
jgi:hypothetical protein